MGINLGPILDEMDRRLHVCESKRIARMPRASDALIAIEYRDGPTLSTREECVTEHEWTRSKKHRVYGRMRWRRKFRRIIQHGRSKVPE